MIPNPLHVIIFILFHTSQISIHFFIIELQYNPYDIKLYTIKSSQPKFEIINS